MHSVRGRCKRRRENRLVASGVKHGSRGNTVYFGSDKHLLVLNDRVSLVRRAEEAGLVRDPVAR